MGGDSYQRLHVKDHFKALEVELQTDYGLSRIASRALVHRILQFIDELIHSDSSHRHPGQILYTAVERHEPAGKPVRCCRLQTVRLSLVSPEDKKLLEQSGSVRLRCYRISRLTQEAYSQGGLLSQEDLRFLLSLDISTIRILSRQSRQLGMKVPTRGYVGDIGSGVSHKQQAIAYYFKGFGPERIASIIGHSMSSVERYLEDFARVVELASRGLQAEQIQRISTLSSSVTRHYLCLFKQYNQPHNRLYLEDLRRRFGPLKHTHEDTSWEG